MFPNLGDAKVDKILTQFSQRYTNDNYIAEKILPVLKVKEKSGKFAKYGTENLRVYSNQIERAPGTRANSVDYSVSQGQYVCTEKALEKLVPDEFKNNTDAPYEPQRDTVALLMDNIWINQEAALKATLSDATIITQNVTLAGTDQWSDYDNSDPIGDIETGINTVLQATGKRPNTIVMGHDVMTKLKYHPNIRDQVRYTNGGQLSDKMLMDFMKDFFNVSEVYVGTALQDTAVEGQPASLSQVWTNDFWLLYKTPRPTLMQATFGYTFTDVARLVDKYRDNPRVGDVVRVRYSYDQNVMDPKLAYGIFDAV